MPVISKRSRVTDTTATLIDNIFISTPTLYTSGIFTDYMNHFPIFILINNYFNCDNITATKNKSIKYRAINSHTLDSFREKWLVQDYTPILDNEDYNMAFSDLEKIIYEIFNHTCTIKIRKFSTKQIQKPWISNNLISYIKKRNAYSILWKTNQMTTDYYKTYRNFVTNEIRIAKRQYYEMEFELKKNIKKTWSLINNIVRPGSIFKNKTDSKNSLWWRCVHWGERDCRKNERIFYNSRCNYSKLCRTESNRPFNIPPGFLSRFILLFIYTFSRRGKYDTLVEKQTLLLIYGASISAEDRRRYCITSFGQSYTYVFFYCSFPKGLKVAWVTPIYKSVNRTQISNYRPISILPNFSKIFEKLIYKQLYRYIDKHNIVYKHQYGFRNKKSTTHAILNLLNYLYRHLESNHNVISVYLDFKKAFDCVDHDILLQKLHHYGIRGIANDFFKSYLSDRYQFTRPCKSDSISRFISCGVP